MFKLIIAMASTFLAGFNLITWAYAPNYWLFGLAFLAFSIIAAIFWMGVIRSAGPSPRGTPVQVYSCARCTQDHQLYFQKFIYHSVTGLGDIVFTHWAICPVLNEPVLMRIVDTEAKHAENY